MIAINTNEYVMCQPTLWFLEKKPGTHVLNITLQRLNLSTMAMGNALAGPVLALTNCAARKGFHSTKRLMPPKLLRAYYSTSVEVTPRLDTKVPTLPEMAPSLFFMTSTKTLCMPRHRHQQTSHQRRMTGAAHRGVQWVVNLHWWQRPFYFGWGISRYTLQNWRNKFEVMAMKR